MSEPTVISPAALIVRLAAVAALSGMAGPSVADVDTVTFVESVRCGATACEAQRRTVPVLQTVRTPDVGAYCVEYTRKLTGFETYDSLDPAIRIRVPQYADGPKRYFRCASGEKLASR